MELNSRCIEESGPENTSNLSQFKYMILYNTIDFIYLFYIPFQYDKNTYESKHSGIDQIKFVEDSL